MTPILASNTTAAFLSLAVVLFYIYEVAVTIPGLVAIGLYWFVRKRQKWRTTGIVLSGVSTMAGAAALVMTFIPAHVEFYGWIMVSIPILVGLLALVPWIRQKRV